MADIWIIKAGRTFANTARQYGDFEGWTSDAMAVSADSVRIYDVELTQPLPEPSQCRGVVITGSHAMVTDGLPWSENVARWIPRLIAEDVPLLGICYGHQLLAQAMNGRVDYHPAGREVGTVEIELLPSSADDPLFGSMPQTFLGHAVHAQTVVQLPPGAVRLARNDFEPNHAFRIGAAAWGVQFHPEYDARIMRSYVTELSDQLTTAGRNVVELMRSVKETPAAREILQRFAQFIHDKSSSSS
jgi:GMP synthase (glutamine-hydrolysing)